MASSGQIDLKTLKATYEIDDVHLIDSRKLESANECRLYYELFYGVGLTFLGIDLSSSTKNVGIFTWIFLLIGTFFLLRYLWKNSKLMHKNNNENSEILEKYFSNYRSLGESERKLRNIISHKLL